MLKEIFSRADMLSKLKQYSWALDLLAYYYSKYENTQYSSKIKLKREFIHKAALENEKNPNITREYLTLEKNVSLVRKWKEKAQKKYLELMKKAKEFAANKNYAMVYDKLVEAAIYSQYFEQKKEIMDFNNNTSCRINFIIDFIKLMQFQHSHNNTCCKIVKRSCLH